MKFQLLLSLTLATVVNGFGQQSAIDTFCQRLDSSLVSENIILRSIRHHTEFEDARYFDHYYIDTSRKVLMKSIYEFNFDGDGELLEFYYRNSEIIKINAQNQFNGRKLVGTFYFESDKLIAYTGGEIVFDIQHMLKTGKEYMIRSKEIINSLKSTSQLPSAANRVTQGNFTPTSSQFR